MIGYHYTSFKNWQSIREHGLTPYVLRRDIVPDGIPGIWIFKNQQQGESHAGCIWFQIKTKRTFHVVELEVEYKARWCDRPGWENTEVVHEGKIVDDDGSLIGFYHRYARAVISWQAIPPEFIRLIGSYELSRAWSRNEQASIGLVEQSNVRKRTV